MYYLLLLVVVLPVAGALCMLCRFEYEIARHRRHVRQAEADELLAAPVASLPTARTVRTEADDSA